MSLQLAKHNPFSDNQCEKQTGKKIRIYITAIEGKPDSRIDNVNRIGSVYHIENYRQCRLATDKFQ